MPKTFAYFFAADGSDFFMISTGLTGDDVAKQACQILHKNRTTTLRATDKGFEMTDSERPRVWRWVPDSEVR